MCVCSGGIQRDFCATCRRGFSCSGGMEAIGKNLDREVKKGKLIEAEKAAGAWARLESRVTDMAAGGGGRIFCG